GRRRRDGAEGIRSEYGPGERPERGEEMRRVGARLSRGGEQAPGRAAFQQVGEGELFGAASEEAIAEFTQDRKVESRIRQLETQQILPVDARADRLRRLAIRQMLPKLPNRHQRQPPRGQGWL